MAAEAFDIFGRGGPRQPNNIIKIKPRGARANSSPLLIGVSHRFRVYGRLTLRYKIREELSVTRANRQGVVRG
jgi:hypothetical protein